MSGEGVDKGRAPDIQSPVREALPEQIPTSSIHQTSTRLIIRKLVLENFKSYAGKHEIGPFNESMTCIVGPNGSGKSNVVDSLQFVFGKKGKSLRLKRLKELIHQSSKIRNLRKASVTVHFAELSIADNEIKSEFSIKRTVNQSSQSSYFINNRPSRFQDIKEKMKSQGINLDTSRFLILQGEVEQIALLKPKAQTKDGAGGLLEYIEDKIGTTHYVELIDKAYEKVEELQEKRGERLNRMKVSEKEKQNLESEREAAVQFLEKKYELADTKFRLAQLRLRVSQKKIEEWEAKLTGPLSQLKKVEEDLERERGSLSGLDKSIENMKNVVKASLLEVKKLKEELKELTEKDHFLKGKKKSWKKKLENYLKSLDRAEKKIKSLKKMKERAEQAEKKLQKAIPEIEKQYKDHQKHLENLYNEKRMQMEPLEQKIESLRESQTPFATRIEKLKNDIQISEERIEMIVSERKRIEKEKKEAEEKLKKSKFQQQQKSRELKLSSSRLKTCRDRLPGMKRKMDEWEKEKEQLQTQRRQLLAEKQRVEVDTQRNTSRNSVLQELLTLKAEGKIPGIHDRLGNLGTIPPKYDVAISTACGYLNYIVVSNTVAGKACVKHLTDNRVGRGNFIMLDQQTRNWGQKANQKIKTPENVPRLVDLVKPVDPVYRAIFYFALRDTLLAKNLTQARRLAYGKSKRWRVVTLEGELIESTGTMSGGGKSQRKGGMQVSESGKDSRKELERIRKDLARIDPQYRKIKNQLDELKGQYESMTHEAKESQKMVSSLQFDVEELAKREISLKKQVSQLLEKKRNKSRGGGGRRGGRRRKRMRDEDDEDSDEEEEEHDDDDDDDEQIISNLKQSIRESKKDKVKNEKEMSKIEKKIKKIQNQMDEVGGSQLVEQKKKVRVLKSQLQSMREDLVKAQTSQENYTSQSTDIEKKLEQLKNQISKSEKSIKVVTEEREQNQDAAVKVLTNLRSKKSDKDNKVKLLQDRMNDKKSREKNLQDLKKKHFDMSESVSKYTRLKEEFTKKITICRVKITEYTAEKLEYKKILDPESVGSSNTDGTQQQQQKQQKQQRMEDEDEEEGEKTTTEQEKMSDDDDNDSNIERRRKPLQSGHQEEERRMKQKILDLTKEISELNVDVSVIDLYRQKEKEFQKRLAELEMVTQQRNEAQLRYEEFIKKRLDEFMKGFTQISVKLKEIYQLITLGGDAELELVDSLDPFAEGIRFSVRPPKKNWKNISNLSGGEKTLSSLALVFALHHYKPTPLYVMDEIDAALDYKNVAIIGNYIRERTRDNAQFVIVSLRNNLFDLADILIGIYKVDEVTGVCTIQPSVIREKLNDMVVSEQEEENQEGQGKDEEQETNEKNRKEEEGSSKMLDEDEVEEEEEDEEEKNEKKDEEVDVEEDIMDLGEE